MNRILCKKGLFVMLIIFLCGSMTSPALFAKDNHDKHFKYFKKGIIEIDQRSALKGRVTKSDGKGFPVTIDNPGSYRLTSNLTPGDASVNAIEITAENVMLDLNGFAIIGPGATGVSAVGQSNVNVVNGSVIGMELDGLNLDIAAFVDRVNALDNGRHGIATQGGSIITNTTANRNGRIGINAGVGCTVTDSKANRNLGHGINVDLRSVVTNNTANVNGGDGINAANRSVVIGNAASQNDRYGLFLRTGTGYSQNVLSENNGTGPNNRLNQVSGGIQMGANTNICGNSYCP